jgi:serine/threonine protein kinase
MPRLSELADLLIKSRVIPRSQWEEAIQACGENLPRILEYLVQRPPFWWDGPAPAPPGLTDYQRDIIQARFDENELHLLRRDLVLNQFLLLERLGQGGQGEVYRSRQLNPPRYAAVKVLIRDTESRRKRFEQEARAMIRIQHPAVARFYLYERIRDLNSEPTDEYLIAMEFVNGTDLQRLVRQSGPVPWPFAVHWISELLAGLDFIHQSGFIHRDVKPENIMIVGPVPSVGVHPDQTNAKLLDFGAVNRVGAAVERTSGNRVFVGTMEYAAPEQWNGEIVVQSDLYALGGALFFMLTGRHVFRKDRREATSYMQAHLHEEAPDIQDFNPETPPEVNQLYRQMIAKKPQDRGTASELRDAFLKLKVRHSPPPAAPPVSELPQGPLRGKTATDANAPASPRKQPRRRRSKATEAKAPNPSMRVADSIISFLEGIFVPSHIRLPSDAGLGLTERLALLFRQPLFLVVLFVILVVLIICLW